MPSRTLSFALLVVLTTVGSIGLQGAATAEVLGKGSAGASGGADRPPLVVEGVQAQDSIFRRADSLFQAGEGAEAVALMREAASAGRRPYEALWRAASYALGVGIVEEAESGSTDRFDQALALARAARDTAAAMEGERSSAAAGGLEDAEGGPAALEARYWEVAALGRLALAAGRRERAGYAEELRRGATDILRRDPDHAGAHHALGVLYMEIMKLSGLSRFLGRTLLGGEAMDEASWERAERHLRRAVEVDPGSLLFRLDLARLHLARDRKEGARRLLVQVRDAEARAPPERVFQAEARRLLEELR